MENNNDYKEERFDSFLNKIIILSSKKYFKKQMNLMEKEKTIVYDEENTNLLKSIHALQDTKSDYDVFDTTMELNNAIKSLSAIEQAVIFLLYSKALSQQEVAEILEIYSKTVSKIKIRAINKLRKRLKEESENEE